MADTAAEQERSKRGAITGWSQFSRNNMRLTLGSLDYTPMFRQGHQLPKMVTLTLPDRWETIAPSARVFKRKLIEVALKQTFRRHWGYDLAAVWKMEFQRRGAPHLHILCAPPSGLCPRTGQTFSEWLRDVWARACSDDESTFEEIQNHRAKGVHIEDTYGLTGTDSKRIADYFVKHGVFSAKEYQNQAPELWEDRPGRFWGYWVLFKGDGEQRLGPVPTPSSDGSPGRVKVGNSEFVVSADSVGLSDPVAGRGDLKRAIMSEGVKRTALPPETSTPSHAWRSASTGLSAPVRLAAGGRRSRPASRRRNRRRIPRSPVRGLMSENG